MKEPIESAQSLALKMRSHGIDNDNIVRELHSVFGNKLSEHQIKDVVNSIGE